MTWWTDHWIERRFANINAVDDPCAFLIGWLLYRPPELEWCGRAVVLYDLLVDRCRASTVPR